MAEKVAFLGLGNMGGALASNLVKAGFEVSGFDPNPSAREAAEKAGVSVFDFPAEAAKGADYVCSAVPTGAQARDAYLGEKGALLAAGEGAVCFDFSTILPEESISIAEEAESRGFHFLDTPISGNALIARDAKIGLMVGGKKEVLDAHRAVLESVCELLDYFGPNGSGLRMKLIANQLVSCQLCALAEGFTLGVKSGLDPDQMMEYLYSSTVFRVMSARGWGLRKKEYEPVKFALALMRKDLGLIGEFARSNGVPLPLTDAVQKAYQGAMDMGLGDLDQGVIREWFEREAGLGGQAGLSFQMPFRRVGDWSD